MFPRKVYVGSSKMSVGCQLSVYRSSQVQIPDYRRRSQIEILFDQLGDLLISNFTCSKGIYKNGNRFCHADGVSQLYLAFVGDSCGYYVFSCVSGRIGRAAVNFCRVFAGIGSAAVTRVSAVAVDDDFSSCKAGITVRSSDYESSRRIYIILGLFVEKFCRNDRLRRLSEGSLS